MCEMRHSVATRPTWENARKTIAVRLKSPITPNGGLNINSEAISTESMKTTVASQALVGIVRMFSMAVDI